MVGNKGVYGKSSIYRNYIIMMFISADTQGDHAFIL